MNRGQCNQRGKKEGVCEQCNYPIKGLNSIKVASSKRG